VEAESNTAVKKRVDESNKLMWEDMAYDTFKERLAKEFLEYKKEAEQIILDELQCLPNLKVRALSELLIRQTLRDRNEGLTTSDSASFSIDMYLMLLKVDTIHYDPEHAPLIDRTGLDAMLKRYEKDQKNHNSS